MGLTYQEKWLEPILDWRVWVPPAAMSVFLFVVAQYDFLTFHTLAELFAILISFTLFTLAWTTYDFSKNSFLIFLACGYLWIGALDLVHTFVYKGMNLFVEGNGNLAVQFWIGTRYSEALLLLAAPFAATRKQNKYLLATVFGVFAIGLTIFIFLGKFPIGFVEGKGLTDFKIYSEYLIDLILVLALIALFHFGRDISTNEKVLIGFAIIITMCAELAFTFYVSVYGLSNLAGHIFKLFSFWLIFRAIVVSNLKRPYAALKESEERLRESENLLNSIIENIPVGLLIKDPDHIVERANDTYLRWYGFDADSMVGLRSDEIEDFQSAEEAEFMNAQEREVLTIGKTLRRQVERPFADGKIHTVNITKFPVYDQQGNITKVGSVSVDLTEQVQAIQAKSLFLAAMGHDLWTPLNAIIGFADSINLQTFGPIGDKYQEYARDIKSSGEHLLSLVNDILDLSTIEASKQSLAKENISVTDVVTECGRIIEEKAQFLGIDLVTKVTKDLPPLYADRRATKQILINLLSNSVKFTPEGGKITLRATATNEHHTFEVSDTGMGIPADKIAAITDPFVKVQTDPHKAQEGTGLGLAIVKSLVERHDGELDIRSKVGKGTTVTVKLPNGAPDLLLFP